MGAPTQSPEMLRAFDDRWRLLGLSQLSRDHWEGAVASAPFVRNPSNTLTLNTGRYSSACRQMVQVCSFNSVSCLIPFCDSERL